VFYISPLRLMLSCRPKMMPVGLGGPRSPVLGDDALLPTGAQLAAAFANSGAAQEAAAVLDMEDLEGAMHDIPAAPAPAPAPKAGGARARQAPAHQRPSVQQVLQDLHQQVCVESDKQSQCRTVNLLHQGNSVCCLPIQVRASQQRQRMLCELWQRSMLGHLLLCVGFAHQTLVGLCSKTSSGSATAAFQGRQGCRTVQDSAEAEASAAGPVCASY
jgi:hypothetical protein